MPVGSMSDGELQKQLRGQLEENEQLKKQAREMSLHLQLDKQQLEKKKWEHAIADLNIARETAKEAHGEEILKIKESGKTISIEKNKSDAVAWLQDQLHK